MEESGFKSTAAAPGIGSWVTLSITLPRTEVCAQSSETEKNERKRKITVEKMDLFIQEKFEAKVGFSHKAETSFRSIGLNAKTYITDLQSNN